MGVLTDLIVADPNEAEQIGKTHSSQPHAAVDVKGFDQIKGATLWCIIDGGDVASVDHCVTLSQQFRCLYEEGDDGPWVYQFPAEFLKALTKVDDARAEEIVAAWANTEEFEGWDIEDVRFYFDSLYDAAASAEAEGKSVLMWICL